MSQTTAAAPLDVHQPAIARATTPGEVIKAMVDDPLIKNAVLNAFVTLAGKSFVASRTVWVTILTPVIAALVTHFGLGFDEATCAEIATGLTTLAALVMRAVTTAPITSVLPVTAPAQAKVI
jgi:hypothetical protein